MSERAFSDEDLTAYLDGEADADLESALSQALETDAALIARLESLDAPIAAIRDGYAALLAEAPEMPDMAPAKAPSYLWRGIGTFGAGIAAGLAVAAVGGLLRAPEAPSPGWKAMVANYQNLYGIETLADATPSAEMRATQMAHVSAIIGLDLSDLPNTAGLTFKRAQVLDFNGRPLAQIAYTRADGTPVALCILTGANPVETPVSASVVQGLGATSWNAGGFGYLLIGGDDPADLAPDTARFSAWSGRTL